MEIFCIALGGQNKSCIVSHHRKNTHAKPLLCGFSMSEYCCSIWRTNRFVNAPKSKSKKSAICLNLCANRANPRNFIAHESRFFKAMWWQKPAWIFDANKMQEKATHKWHISVISDFKKSQKSITLTPLQEQIYTFLYNHKYC